MSAPALAQDTAICASRGRLWSLSTSPPWMTPQWPWSVYSQRHTSAMSCSSGTESFSARSAFWTMPSSAQAPVPARVLVAGDAEEDDRGHAHCPRPLRLLDRQVHREVVDSRHRGHRLPNAPALDDEERIDEVGGAGARSRAPCAGAPRCGAVAGDGGWGRPCCRLRSTAQSVHRACNRRPMPSRLLLDRDRRRPGPGPRHPGRPPAARGRVRPLLVHGEPARAPQPRAPGGHRPGEQARGSRSSATTRSGRTTRMRPTGCTPSSCRGWTSSGRRCGPGACPTGSSFPGTPGSTFPGWRALGRRAAAVVSDWFPSFIIPGHLRGAARALDVPLVAVDASCVVPMQRIPERQVGAYALRPKLRKLWPEYLGKLAEGPEPAHARAAEQRRPGLHPGIVARPARWASSHDLRHRPLGAGGDEPPGRRAAALAVAPHLRPGPGLPVRRGTERAGRARPVGPLPCPALGTALRRRGGPGLPRGARARPARGARRSSRSCWSAASWASTTASTPRCTPSCSSPRCPAGRRRR